MLMALLPLRLKSPVNMHDPGDWTTTLKQPTRITALARAAVAALLFALLLSGSGCTFFGPDPAEEEAKLKAAKIAYESGRFEEAAKKFREVIKRDPDDLEARRTYGLVLAALGDNPAAVEQYAVVVKRDPSDHASFYRMAVLERILSRPKDSEKHLQAALDLVPGNAGYVDELARTKMSLGEYQAAATLWGSLVDKPGRSKAQRKELLVLQGQAYQDAKDYKRAKRAFESALRLYPRDQALIARVESFK